MLLSCGAGEGSWESLGLQGDPTNQSEISRNQLRIFIGKTDVEAETPILWPSDTKIWLTGKDPNVGEDWGQEETGVAEDEMVGWHHWLNGHKFEQILGDSGGQGSLVCCSSWGRKELDTTWQLKYVFLTVGWGSKATILEMIEESEKKNTSLLLNETSKSLKTFMFPPPPKKSKEKRVEIMGKFLSLTYNLKNIF